MQSNDHTREGLDELIKQSKFGPRILQLSLDESGGFGFILAKAQQSYLEALDALTELDVSEPGALAKVQKLQNDMKRYADMVAWISEAVEASRDATDELKQRQAEEEELEGELAAEEKRANYYGIERSD